MATKTENKLGTELELVDILRNFLSEQEYAIEVEVPNMGQSADLVAQKGDEITLIEAKLKDWKRAMGQCVAHEIVADYICIAVSTVSVPLGLYAETLRKGYGLIHCDPYSKTCDWIVQPVLNKNVWEPQKEVFVRKLKEISCAY